MALELTDSNFEEEVMQSEKLVLVDFWAAWCGPCKMLAPIIEEVEQELGNKAKIAKMNVDDNPQTPSKYGIRGIPTLILFKGGKHIDTKVGLLQKEQIIEWLEQHINP